MTRLSRILIVFLVISFSAQAQEEHDHGAPEKLGSGVQHEHGQALAACMAAIKREVPYGGDIEMIWSRIRASLTRLTGAVWIDPAFSVMPSCWQGFANSWRTNLREDSFAGKAAGRMLDTPFQRGGRYGNPGYPG